MPKRRAESQSTSTSTYVLVLVRKGLSLRSLGEAKPRPYFRVGSTEGATKNPLRAKRTVGVRGKNERANPYKFAFACSGYTEGVGACTYPQRNSPSLRVGRAKPLRVIASKSGLAKPNPFGFGSASPYPEGVWLCQREAKGVGQHPL